MLGEEEELAEFRKLTGPEFPIGPVNPLIFFELIGKEPPRFYYTSDGRILGFLDELKPTPEKLLEFVSAHARKR